MSGATIIRTEILDNAKGIANAVHEIKDIELYARVLDLNRGIMGLAQENCDFRTAVDELKKKLQLQLVETSGGRSRSRSISRTVAKLSAALFVGKANMLYPPNIRHERDNNYLSLGLSILAQNVDAEKEDAPRNLFEYGINN